MTTPVKDFMRRSGAENAENGAFDIVVNAISKMR